MSLDTVRSIGEVIFRVREGVGLDEGNPCNGWLNNAPKEEIINWLKTNILDRIQNAYDNAMRDVTGKDPREKDENPGAGTKNRA